MKLVGYLFRRKFAARTAANGGDSLASNNGMIAFRKIILFNDFRQCVNYHPSGYYMRLTNMRRSENREQIPICL